MKTLNRKLILGLPLLILLLTTIFVPAVLSAQGEKVGLSINLMPWEYRSELTPGIDNSYYLEITNYGEIDINNIRFAADPPDGWEVTFSPDNLARLTAGSSNTIDVNIVPSEKAEKGSYYVFITATANETKAVTSAYLIIESGPSYWVWLGIGIGVLAIIGFIVIFIKSSKS